MSHWHFIGIGGSGMSALAALALSAGHAVSGSDAAESPTLAELSAQGATVFAGHDARHLPEAADRVIYSEAVDLAANPELLEAKRRGLSAMSYFAALGEFSRTKKTLAIAGTHGKTTTTAMTGVAFAAAGLDPMVVVGSRVPEFGGKNWRAGRGEWLVAEACEYRRSFLNLHPFGAIVLNAEPDHLDYYRDAADYASAFFAFAERIPADGFLVFNAEDPVVHEAAARCAGRTIPVTRAAAEAMDLHLSVPGAFNRLNAAHALLAAGAANADAAPARRAVEAYAGAARRMERRGETNGILIMDDYGHHPTEVRSTLAALHAAYPERRLICVFQPHQYSRTIQLLSGFETAFEAANTVLIPNIYRARDTEEDVRRISAEGLAAAISKHHPHALAVNGFTGALNWLKQNTRAGDLVVTMGAGDVFKIGTAFLNDQNSV